MWVQYEMRLKPYPRGFHLITADILRALPEIKNVSVGILNVFVKHTSASLTINENADPTVRDDFESVFNQLVPENKSYYRHNCEGGDDLPAHIKNSILGSSLNVPVTSGELNIGIWQGIYLCEHRNKGGSRKLLLTLHGR